MGNKNNYLLNEETSLIKLRDLFISLSKWILPQTVKVFAKGFDFPLLNKRAGLNFHFLNCNFRAYLLFKWFNIKVR